LADAHVPTAQHGQERGDEENGDDCRDGGDAGDLAHQSRHDGGDDEAGQDDDRHAHVGPQPSSQESDEGEEGDQRADHRHAPRPHRRPQEERRSDRDDGEDEHDGTGLDGSGPTRGCGAHPQPVGAVGVARRAGVTAIIPPP